jgi:hypothetical protein
MKKQNILFIASLIAVGASSCGKGLNTQTKSEAANGDSGFILVNAAFVDGSADCGGKAGAAVKFGVYQSPERPKEDTWLASGIYDLAACTDTDVSNPPEANLAAGSAADTAAVDSESPKTGLPDNEQKFIALCESLAKSGKSETLQALDAISGTTGTVGAAQPTDVAKSGDGDFLLTDAGQPQNNSEGQNNVTTPAPEVQASYCQKLYAGVKDVTRMDLSSSSPQVSDLRLLKYLPSIKYLNLSHNPVVSGAAISSLDLISLDISETPLVSEGTYFRWK